MEKEKRQNAEGNGQYLRLKDLAADDERFARMLADPWSSEVKRGIKRLFFFCLLMIMTITTTVYSEIKVAMK